MKRAAPHGRRRQAGGRAAQAAARPWGPTFRQRPPTASLTTLHYNNISFPGAVNYSLPPARPPTCRRWWGPAVLPPQPLHKLFYYFICPPASLCATRFPCVRARAGRRAPIFGLNYLVGRRRRRQRPGRRVCSHLGGPPNCRACHTSRPPSTFNSLTRPKIK